MLPVTKNISVYQGDTFSLLFRLREKNLDGTPGPYLNLTGATVEAKIAKKSDGSVSATFTSEITSATGGEALITLTPTQSAKLDENGKWDAQVTFPDGRVQTYLRGNVTLLKQV